MKQRPILFNGEMVRAILDGRKTQTRRVMKVQPSCDFSPLNMALELDFTARWYTPGIVDRHGYLQPAKHDVFGVASEDEGYSCPLGAVGDRFWVREAFQGPLVDMELADDLVRNPDKYQKPEFCEYRADGGKAPEYVDMEDNLRQGWKPSIHMPRWASRITLEITGVRVERLNGISEDDAGKEGYPADPSPYGGSMDKWLWFRELWDSIYPEQSFKHNPWVWVVEFKMVDAS